MDLPFEALPRVGPSAAEAVAVVGVVTAFLGIEHVRETIDRLDDLNIDERRRRDESSGVRSY